MLLICAGCGVNTAVDTTGDGSGDSLIGSTDASPVGVYNTAQLTNFGVEISCAECHGQDGSGGQDTAGRPVVGIQGVSAQVLADHAQGDARHPAPTGRVPLKFPDLSAADFDAMARFLSQQ